MVVIITGTVDVVVSLKIIDSILTVSSLSIIKLFLLKLGINDGDTGTRLALTFFGTKPYPMFEQHIKSVDGVEGPFKSYEDVIKELEHYNNKTVLHDIKRKTGK
jgi:hypothetical protein